MLPFALMVYASLSTSFNFLFFPWCIFMNGHGKLAVTGPKSNFQLYCAIILLCIPPSHCLRSLGPRWYHEWQHNKCMVTWCVSKACLQAADCGSCWGREGAQSVLLSCKTTEEPFKKEWFPKIHSQHFPRAWFGNMATSSLPDRHLQLPGLVMVLHQPPQPASVACFHVLSPSMLRFHECYERWIIQFVGSSFVVMTVFVTPTIAPDVCYHPLSVIDWHSNDYYLYQEMRASVAPSHGTFYIFSMDPSICRYLFGLQRLWSRFAQGEDEETSPFQPGDKAVVSGMLPENNGLQALLKTHTQTNTSYFITCQIRWQLWWLAGTSKRSRCHSFLQFRVWQNLFTYGWASLWTFVIRQMQRRAWCEFVVLWRSNLIIQTPGTWKLTPHSPALSHLSHVFFWN